MATKNRLAELLAAQGWSREDLAQRLHRRGIYGKQRRTIGRGATEPIKGRTIYRWEIGETAIPDDVKAALADLFGVSLDHLMGRDDGNGNNHEAAA